MELTRRDALAALVAAGVAVGLAELDPLDGARRGGDGGAGELADRELDALVAVAGVVYPSAVTDAEAFVREYALGRASDTAHADGVREAIDTLDAYAGAWHDAAFLDLDGAARESLLDSMGVDAADPDPDGADRERVRYYLVNDLLFALYASPTGGRLVGIENPPGHPGGTDSYRRGSPDG